MCVVLILRGQVLAQTSETNQPTIKQMTVNDLTLKYLEQGQGETVVFVHGSVSDHRVWEEQREGVVAQGYRYVALDLRYHGSSPWTDDGSKWSMATHASDLAAFIQQLDAGPVHVVGWSSGCNFTIALAVQHPKLVRSVFAYEPVLESLVSDPEDLDMLGKEREGFGPIVTASQAGDQPKAAQLLIDWVNAQSGTFDTLPAWRRNVVLENSRTMPPDLASLDLPITCDQLGQITMPVTVVKGQQSRPYFVILADTTHECIPGSQLATVPNARHLAPGENPTSFNEALLSHLARAD